MDVFIFILTFALITADNVPATCPGRDGRDGLPGRDGSSGRDGVTVIGPPGRDGVDGRDGTDCIECAKGPKGMKGDRGFSGFDGKPGQKGANGLQGPQGIKGAKGSKGDQGLKGDTGDKGEKGVCDFKILTEIRQGLQSVQKQLEVNNRRIDSLKTENQKLKSQLSGMLESNSTIKHSFLPAGYGKYTLYDIQWQSLHMAAAAACRGSAPNGGSGSSDNYVIPRRLGLTCQKTCSLSARPICTAEVSIDGYMHHAKRPGERVATFYNYGCLVNKPWGHEIETENSKIVGGSGYISYCCCKK